MQLWEGLASVPGTVCQCPSFHHDSPLGKALPGPQTDRLSRVAEQPGRFSAGDPRALLLTARPLPTRTPSWGSACTLWGSPADTWSGVALCPAFAMFL